MISPKGRGAAWTEPKGRGAAWTEERGAEGDEACPSRRGAPPSGLTSEGARNERPREEGRRRVKRPEASEREKQRPEASEQVNQRPGASEQETQLIWAARLAIADFRLAAWFWWMTPLLTALSSLT
jgi:hypothetical protein